ncbi:MAG: DNA polymerase III subunit alpha [Candidatus Saccharimonas sp.]|nr:MAG: DNA polymerase III subunit alpha [Candidatus Saccharimonas sp.]
MELEEKIKTTKTFEELVPSDFVHLHTHTYHSLLDGLTKIDDLVDNVKASGMEAVAITDHGTMSGAIEFFKEATSKGVKPILGIEAYVAARTRFDRDPSYDKPRYHLVLLAKNQIGWQNLCSLTTKAWVEGQYYKPRIDHDIMAEHSEGIICLSGCAGSEISESIRAGDFEKAKELANWYKSVYGEDFYLELQDHGHPECPNHWEVQKEINDGLFRLHEELDIPMVVTCDSHYLTHENQDAHEILLCVGTGSYLNDEKRMSLKEFDLFVTDPRDIIERWGKVDPEIILNTKKIAEKVNFEFEFGKILIPKFPLPEGEESEKGFLDKLVFQGLGERYAGIPVDEVKKMTIPEIRKKLSKEVIERVDMELGVLDGMGYNGYFLIVQDFINWGKSQGIVFGPGRGSAAGSIIAYALHITDLDPLEYDLLFERFLNPDRISMPDIDVDIQDTRRNEVIQYCTDKYGIDRVANIATFGKMMAKNAVRDVARVLEVPYSEADRMAKLVPDPNQGRHIPLRVSLENDQDLKHEYETNPTAKTVYDFAMQLEGTIRNHGVHACGVVIAPDDLVKYLPLEMAQKGVVATQVPMGQVEDLGLLKMDFLGLKNLSIISTAQKIVKKTYGIDLDLSKLGLDDKKAYELLARGDSTGVFQLESAGMKRYLRELKPSKFEDIIAMVALYRPGPMSEIPKFIARKHGEEPVTYYEDHMENALKNTYGILVYQEQFMQISKEVCGFTGGQADTLRKAVGKKKIDLMKKMKGEFIEGAVKHSNADRGKVEAFWEHLEEFANYCFNKSHAACYALIAYWTAYIKAHYPDAFMAALMTADSDDTDRLAIEIAECRSMGIEVLGPDVNESFKDFAIVPHENKIRFGLLAVKAVGSGAVDAVLNARKADGKFTSILDFAKRVNARQFNKKAWDSLIMTGAFDQFGTRSDLLFNLERIQEYGSKSQKEALSGQTDLFGFAGAEDMRVESSIELINAPKQHTDKERLTWERELLGLYVSAHPLDRYVKYFEEQTQPLSQVQPNTDGQKATIGGIVIDIRTIITKSGTKMAFVKMEDKTSEGEVIIFPNLYSEISEKLKIDAVLKIEGKISARDREGNLKSDAQIIAETVSIITDEELENYESTGRRADDLKARKVPQTKTVSQNVSNIQKKAFTPKNNSSAVLNRSSEKSTSNPSRSAENYQAEKIQRVFVHIKNPSDHESLLSVKKICGKFPGMSEIILVLGEVEKSAIRMPFKVDSNSDLPKELVRLLGEDCVVLKD